MTERKRKAKFKVGQVVSYKRSDGQREYVRVERIVWDMGCWEYMCSPDFLIGGLYEDSEIGLRKLTKREIGS